MSVKADLISAGVDCYEIKPVGADVLEQAEDIWSLAFGRFWPRNYEHKALDLILGAFAGNELHAVVAIIDLEMNFADQRIPCAGISAVATAPGQRYKRLINKLLAEGLRQAHDRKVPIASLYPFSFPFYERMGWAATHRQYTMNSTTAHLKMVSGSGVAGNFRMLGKEDCLQILPVHDRWSQKWNMSLALTPTRCQHVAGLSTQNRQYFLNAENDGYMVWNLDKSVGRTLYVSEFAYNTDQAYLDGLALLGQMDAQYDQIEWEDADYQRFLKLGVAPIPRMELKVGMMTRVVNMAAFSQLLPSGCRKTLQSLDVYDPLSVSAGAKGTVGVGQLLQHVTGFFDQPDSALPIELHGIVGQKPAFCFDKF